MYTAPEVDERGNKGTSAENLEKIKDDLHTMTNQGWNCLKSNMKAELQAPKFFSVTANFGSAVVVGIPVGSEESTGIAVDNAGP